MAVPKSGCSRIRPTIAPTTIAIGSSEYDSSSMRCMRRSSMSAVNSTHGELGELRRLNAEAADPEPAPRRR